MFFIHVFNRENRRTTIETPSKYFDFPIEGLNDGRLVCTQLSQTMISLESKGTVSVIEV